MKEKDFSMKQGCNKIVLQRYICSLMDVATICYNKEINHQNLPTIHPKSVLGLVDYRGKLLATFDGWFVSY
jgi:hypothetical protein